MSSPPGKPPSTHRITDLKGYIPLSQEASLSTRGQHLPALIQSRSTGNLAELHAMKQRRRTSNDFLTLRQAQAQGQGQTQAQGQESDGDVEAQRDGAGGRGREREGDDRRTSLAVLMTPQMRSQRLIGNTNPRYKWEQYWKTEEQLKKMKKPIRKYYERNNYLIQRYMYIDRLLDSSLPHNLLNEYSGVPNHSSSQQTQTKVPPTITEEPHHVSGSGTPTATGQQESPLDGPHENGYTTKKIKRTPRALYTVQDENTPLLKKKGEADEDGRPIMPPYEPEEETGSQHRIVTIAIYINLVANTVLLIMKAIVAVLTSSVSVLASLVDAALDFLSTGIVWTTTRLISRHDQHAYPIGRRRLEPLGVLVFSVIMVTSFFQVALQGLNHLTSDDHTIVQLTIAAIAIMVATVVIKFVCWLWCRLINNSSVQALAQDAMTDVVFNIFSIIFPLVGYYASVWWLDPLGGILLSFYVIFNWSSTSVSHIRNLTGAAASADERNILLYLTMRFAKTITQIQGLQAYHSGDKLNVEVEIVLDENMSLRDSHDLGESLQYVLESVPTVDRAFVHLDYAGYNLPTHMQQQD
ncbi:hypothetical protein LTR50_005735 [Elasticomyces elasticus]|nr:hypothetical protein LTR50_005735 [Elasticomyces elasticus]